MAQSQRKLAKSMGVGKDTVCRAKKSLGIKSKTLNDKEAELVKEVVKETAALKKSTAAKTSKTSENFKPNVRRIDVSDKSSVVDLLQDCKEQYVKNEGLIQRLQYEIDNQDILMHGNGNGTLSPLPQLGLLEKFQKVNISLRNQIMSLEEELGRYAEEHEDDPFE